MLKGGAMTANNNINGSLMQSGSLKKNRSLFQIGLILGVIIFTGTKTVYADENRILGAQILSETTNEITLSIKYNYSGNKGKNVFMNAVMGDKGKPSSNYSTKPARIYAGTHDVILVLGVRRGAQDVFSTNQLIVSMYTGGEDNFLKQSFEYSKTWAKFKSSLKPVHFTLAKIKPAIIPRKRSSGEPENSLPRTCRILSNGHVEIVNTNGIKRQYFPGGETIIGPDGKKVDITPYSYAQHPTPPTAPPDDQHAEWITYESAQLLSIISNLVGNDEESINNYLQNEGEKLSPYEQITARTTTINLLLKN